MRQQIYNQLKLIALDQWALDFQATDKLELLNAYVIITSEKAII